MGTSIPGRITAATACALLTGCLSEAPEAPPPAPPATSAPTFVLVSWDTTRADGLSCYADALPWRPELPADQRPAPDTPVADALARDGVRFAWALAPAPTTLSSHTAMFSGVDSHTHQVVRNGYAVPPSLPLMTERFADAGWTTIAAVGSAALEASMGLSRGFTAYVDHSEGAPRDDYIVIGKQVTASALRAVDAAPADRPLFLFVHYYDVHMPWVTASAETRRRFVDPRYGGPVDGAPASLAYLTTRALRRSLTLADARQARALYLAQVATVDQELGTLLRGLDTRGRLDDAVVVLTADHGEVLDEGEGRKDLSSYSHGPDVDLVATHVPLIVTGRGRFADQIPAATVIDRPVGLVDLPRTLLQLAGLDTRLGAGLDLTAVWSDTPPPVPAYFAEAQHPHEAVATDRWPNLPLERAVTRGDRLYVHAPHRVPLDPTAAGALYAVAAGQPAVDDPSTAAALRAELDAWDARAPAHRATDMAAETSEALKALGYVGE